MSLLLNLIFIWINLAIWYCLRGGGHGFIFVVVVFCFFSSWESSFILAHWVSTLGRACSARENCVDTCPARQSSRHRWALAQLVHMVLPFVHSSFAFDSVKRNFLSNQTLWIQFRPCIIDFSDQLIPSCRRTAGQVQCQYTIFWEIRGSFSLYLARKVPWLPSFHTLS